MGKIKKADIELKDLTIICGPNSSNKTWLSYLIGNMLTTIYMPALNEDVPEEFRTLAIEVIEKGTSSIDLNKAKSVYVKYLQSTIQDSKENLPNYFKADKDALSELYFDLDIDSFSEQVGFVDDEWFSSTSKTFFKVENDKVIATLSTPQDIKNKKEAESRQRDVTTSLILFISGFISSYSFMRPHIVSSERTGALLFQVEMDRSTIAIDEIMRSLGNLEIAPNDKKQLMSGLLDILYSTRSRLPVPVNMNVKDVRDIAKTKEKQSRIAELHPEIIEILDYMNGGEFIIDDNELKFLQKDSSQTFTISSTSSSIKSIFLIDLIIRHKVAADEIILIDEPELNLHPDNQRLMARLIVRLINAGVKVLITTHSDFLIREINNAIALNNDFDGKEEFLAKHEYIDADLLDGSRVSAYAVDKEGHVEPMPMSKFGIETTIFDELINKANDFQDEILYKIEPTLFED